MSFYIALIRSLNVGGKNVIKMEELKQLFIDLGFSEVKTYIQSGNVIFQSNENDKSKLKSWIEEALSKKLNNQIITAVITKDDIKSIILEKPKDFGENPLFRYDVLFLIEPTTASDVANALKIKEGVDFVYAGQKAVYISILKEQQSKSQLVKINQSPIYKSVTIRNWNTTKKLADL